MPPPSSRPVIIEAALNGGTRKAANPHVPTSTDELVRDGLACLEAGASARNVWNVSQTSHDEVGQFAMAEQQRAAAQAPQGEVKVKQIKLDTPKVGRNEPCPCGSGKKYKKCCGAAS